MARNENSSPPDSAATFWPSIRPSEKSLLSFALAFWAEPPNSCTTFAVVTSPSFITKSRSSFAPAFGSGPMTLYPERSLTISGCYFAMAA